MDYLAKLAECRRRFDFDTPESVKVIFGEKMSAVLPTSLVNEKARRIEFEAMNEAASIYEAANSQAESVDRQFIEYSRAAHIQKAGAYKRTIWLLGQCIHTIETTPNGDKIYQPLGEEVAENLDPSVLAELGDALDRAFNLIDPQIEEMSQEEFDEFAEDLKKKTSTEIITTLRDSDFRTLVSFTATLVARQ